MYKGDNPTFLVRLRRWWKGYQSELRWKGYILPLLEDFMPGYYKLNKLYWAIRHRTIDVYHKIDTKLPPEYYDIETLMEYGMFSLLCRYVEEEQDGEAKMLEFIKNLESNWDTNFEDVPEEHREDHRKASQRQADEMKEALRLWHWWKDVFPKYEDYENNPWSKHCDKQRVDGTRPDIFGRSTPCAFDKDGDPTLYSLDPADETPEEHQATREALDASHKYEEQCEKETTEALIALIKLRHTLWT